MTENTVFSYKQGSSFLHRCPAWFKILVLPLLSIFFFRLDPIFILVLFSLQTLVSFLLHFTLKEQLRDLKAVLYYALFLIIAKIAGFAFIWLSKGSFNVPPFETWFEILFEFLISEKETGILLLKLLCAMQAASIIFKTSTSLEIREGLAQIELFLRKPFSKNKKKVKSPGEEELTLILENERPATPVAEAVSIFICFIPQVSKNWQQAKLAWLARGGKKSIKMLYVLLPVFFSVGMKQAYNSARAISIRK